MNSQLPLQEQIGREQKRDEALKAKTIQGKREENNYDNGNWCETVYLDERKSSGNYERQVTIKLNNTVV